MLIPSHKAVMLLMARQDLFIKFHGIQIFIQIHLQG